jgi:ankyrin repeat protein
MAGSFDQLVAAVQAGSVDETRGILARNPEVRRRLDEPHPRLPFDSTVLLAAVHQRNRELIGVLLDAGADINVRSRWWAGGFGVLDGADPSLVPFLIERGAIVDAHAAARLGMIEELDRLLTANPELVRARGGDGQTPLHFAENVEVARLLVDHGADIDAIDVDHEGTPAQYMVRDRQEVARYLVSRGARTDLLLTAALGDLERTRQHLDRDPHSINMTVSDRYFPKRDPRSGGIIYIWTLGADTSPHAAAREFGHEDVLALLMERSPITLQFAEAAGAGDAARLREIVATTPNLVAQLPDEYTARLVHAAKRNDTGAVKLMLGVGWPAGVRVEGGTALHWASFHGNLEMVRELFQSKAPVDARDDQHDGTPLGWALHGSKHGWYCRTGDYGGTIEALLDAGAKPPDVAPEDASEAAIAALLRHRSRS